MADLAKKIAGYLMGDIVSRGMGFLTTVYLARVLDAEGFGLISIALSFLGYFYFFADFGLHNIGVREVAKTTEAQKFTTKEIFTLKIIFGISSFTISISILPLLNFDELQIELIKGFLISLIAYAFMMEWYFYGKQKYFTNSVAQSIRSAVYLGLIIIFVKSYNDILYIPYLYTTTISIAVIILFVVSLNVNAFKAPFRGINYLKKLFYSTSKIGTGLFFTNIIQLLPPLVIGFFLTARDAGLYSAAFKMIIIVMLVDRLLVNLLIPNLSYQWNENKELAEKNLKRANSLMLTAGSLLAVGMAVGAPDFAIWVFGNGYTESVPILIILCGMVFLTFQNSMYTYGLMAIGKDKEFLLSTTLSGVMAFLLIVLAAKLYNVEMVAYAVVLSELIITFVSFVWFSRFVSLKSIMASITTISLSVLVYIASLATQITPWMEALLATLILFILLYICRVIRLEELNWLKNKLVS